MKFRILGLSVTSALMMVVAVVPLSAASASELDQLTDAIRSGLVAVGPQGVVQIGIAKNTNIIANGNTSSAIGLNVAKDADGLTALVQGAVGTTATVDARNNTDSAVGINVAKKVSATLAAQGLYYDTVTINAQNNQNSAVGGNVYVGK